MSDYLDLAPMIVAIGERPFEFDKRGRDLRHLPSRHRFRFDADHHITVEDTRCACAELPIRRDQAQELEAAVERWERDYWLPLLARRAAERRVREINRAFASHFKKPTIWRRLWNGIQSLIVPRRYRFSFDHIDPDLPEDADLVSASLPSDKRAAAPADSSPHCN